MQMHDAAMRNSMTLISMYEWVKVYKQVLVENQRKAASRSSLLGALQ